MTQIRAVTLVVAVLASLAATILVTWHYARLELRVCVVDENLQPIAALLEENRKIVESLKSDGYADSESAIITSYMARIRKDGVPKNSAMKQRIDAMSNNNTVILALLSKYATHAKTAAFKTAADHYRDYALSFRDQWQSVFEIFMAGGNLPAAGTVASSDLLNAVKGE